MLQDCYAGKDMSSDFFVQMNGNRRDLPDLEAPVTLALLIEALQLKADRVAVELNGEIAPRTAWARSMVNSGDKLEIVHFVGGGCLGLKSCR